MRFSADSRTPVPYQRCYCSICRKTAGGGGFAINLGADAATLHIGSGEEAIAVFRAEIEDEDGGCVVSRSERRFCKRCGTALWAFSPEYPDLIHPFASAIDGDLPTPPASVHMMLRFKASWVVPQIGPDDACHDEFPDTSLEEWHKAHGVLA